jgi:hypothetical protein
MRNGGDRHCRHGALRQGIRPQGPRGQNELGAPDHHPVAGDCGAQGRRLPASGQGRRRQGGGAIPQDAAPRIDDQGRSGGDLGRPHRADDPARQLDGPVAPLRCHLVPGRHSQVPPAIGRGTFGVLLSATVRAGLAAVLSGGHRQGSGPPQHRHARRAGDRAARDRAVRDRARHPADLSVFARHQPDRRRARRPVVPTFAGVADRLFSGPPRRRFGGAGARAG